MKKLLYVSVLCALVFPIVSFAAMPAGCQASYKFSPVTGQTCVDQQTQAKDCNPGDLFSFVTGKSCTDVTTTTTDPVITDNTASLTQEYNVQLQDLEQQISDIETKYNSDKAAVQTQAIPLAFQQARIQKLMDDAFNNIQKLQLQEHSLYTDYQSNLSTDNQSRSNTQQNINSASIDTSSCPTNRQGQPVLCGVGA